jgi:hypothetical protein
MEQPASDFMHSLSPCSRQEPSTAHLSCSWALQKCPPEQCRQSRRVWSRGGCIAKRTLTNSPATTRRPVCHAARPPAPQSASGAPTGLCASSLQLKQKVPPHLQKTSSGWPRLSIIASTACSQPACPHQPGHQGAHDSLQHLLAACMPLARARRLPGPWNGRQPWVGLVWDCPVWPAAMFWGRGLFGCGQVGGLALERRVAGMHATKKMAPLLCSGPACRCFTLHPARASGWQRYANRLGS